MNSPLKKWKELFINQNDIKLIQYVNQQVIKLLILLTLRELYLINKLISRGFSGLDEIFNSLSY